jgi:ubiquinone/menaquinone biosynthesis C-methylase UbiE
MRPRVPETNEGIQNAVSVEIFDLFARGLRDKGFLPTDRFLKAGISGGKVLELGPGPGYVGLEFLKRAPGAELTGLEISPAMIRTAQKNAREYGFSERVRYVEGNCMRMPFPNESFGGVISESSLHEWEHPEGVFNEILRVLTPGGAFCITDLRRDINPVLCFLISRTAKPKEIRPGFFTSLHAAYTTDEIREILGRTDVKDYAVSKDFMGLTVAGTKATR